MPYSFGLKWNLLQSLKNSITVEAVEIKKAKPALWFARHSQIHFKTHSYKLDIGFYFVPFFLVSRQVSEQ